MEIEWRKFYRLLGTMPIDQSLFFAPQYKAFLEDGEEGLSDEPPKDWWKAELDKKRGRKRERVATSLDTLIKDQKNVAKEEI